jgi:hypothetical protein
MDENPTEDHSFPWTATLGSREKTSVAMFRKFVFHRGSPVSRHK